MNLMQALITALLCASGLGCLAHKQGSGLHDVSDSGSLKSLAVLNRDVLAFFGNDAEELALYTSLFRTMEKNQAAILGESYAAIEVVNEQSVSARYDPSNPKALLLANSILHMFVHDILSACFVAGDSLDTPSNLCNAIDPRIGNFVQSVVARDLESVKLQTYTVWRKAFGADPDLADAFQRWSLAVLDSIGQSENNNDTAAKLLVSIFLHPKFLLNR